MSEHRSDSAMSVDRIDELDESLLRERLRRARVARIGYVDGDQPIIVPVNVATDDEARIVFRTAVTGPLSALDGRRVAIEVDGYDTTLRSGWSILVQGVARDITTASDVAAQRLRRLPVDCWAPGSRERMFVVLPLSLTSRVIHLGGGEDWFAGVPAS
jgi:nitroimidazol reductase NimA-like FMN-containing flavoprotein (pyridoxamine 5'-phosphate oxidase superfamily)